VEKYDASLYDKVGSKYFTAGKKDYVKLPAYLEDLPMDLETNISTSAILH
jgi:hypothetical protein